MENPIPHPYLFSVSLYTIIFISVDSYSQVSHNMKRIIHWLKGLFRLPTTKQVVWGTPFDGGVSYTILYVNGLTPSQIGIIINNSINNFSGLCKPFRCMAGGSGVRFEFGTKCISGEGLKRVMDKTFESRGLPIPQIKTILCDGIQLYPIQSK
jgi:hypothetical protein